MTLMPRNMPSLILAADAQTHDQLAPSRDDHPAPAPNRDMLAAASALGMHFLMIALTAQEIRTTHLTLTGLVAAAALVFVLPFIVGQTIRSCEPAHATPERR